MPQNEPTLKELPEGTFELPIGYTDLKGDFHKTFTLKPMTGITEEAMLDKKIRTNPSKVLTALITGVVDGMGTLKKFKKEDAKALYNPDRDFILVQNYLNSIGEEAEWVEKCPRCGEQNNLSVDMTQIPVTYLTEEDEKTFKVTLKHGVVDSEGVYHKELTMGIPDGFTQEGFLAMMQENLSRAVSFLMSSTTEDIEGMERWSEDNFRALTMKDRKAIQDAFANITAGPDLSVDTECAHCSHEYQTTIPVNLLMGE